MQRAVPVVPADEKPQEKERAQQERDQRPTHGSVDHADPGPWYFGMAQDGPDRDHQQDEEPGRPLEDTTEAAALAGGLDGSFNASIAKLVLARHGYSDKIETQNVNVEMGHEEWLDSLEEQPPKDI